MLYTRVYPRCRECGDECEAELPENDGCLCYTGGCLFCFLGCGGDWW